MKTILEFLNEEKEMAWHTRLCYSKTYSMETPKDGWEKEFSNAVRDCEIVEELINVVRKEQHRAANQIEGNAVIEDEFTPTVSAKDMIDDFDQELRQQIKSHHYPFTTTNTAAAQLYGFKAALKELRIIGDDDCLVEIDHFKEKWG